VVVAALLALFGLVAFRLLRVSPLAFFFVFAVGRVRVQRRL
jgi:hypothetical protein